MNKFIKIMGAINKYFFPAFLGGMSVAHILGHFTAQAGLSQGELGIIYLVLMVGSLQEIRITDLRRQLLDGLKSVNRGE